MVNDRNDRYSTRLHARVVNKFLVVRGWKRDGHNWCSFLYGSILFVGDGLVIIVLQSNIVGRSTTRRTSRSGGPRKHHEISQSAIAMPIPVSAGGCARVHACVAVDAGYERTKSTAIQFVRWSIRELRDLPNMWTGEFNERPVHGSERRY